MGERSIEGLLARWALAAKATNGPWEKVDPKEEPGIEYRNVIMAVREDDHSVHSFEILKLGPFGRLEDVDFLAANSPDVVMADIDEILRLRTEVTVLTCMNNALHKELRECRGGGK